MSSGMPLLGGVELGGTKCVCILGTGPDDIRAQVRVPTGERQATLREIVAVFDGWESVHGPLAALGIASFGPLDLRLDSRTYGYITVTAKRGWSATDIVGRLRRGGAVPVGFNTDVNGAALAERRWGAARGLTDFAYVTVGTGVGVGLVVAGRTVFGCHHTELGHLRVVRVPGDDWPGACEFHGACVEGLASGPAIAARAARPAADLPAGDPAWGFAAHALAQLAHALVLATGPQRILMGGGVVEAHPELLIQVRERLKQSLNGYLALEELTEGLDRFLVPPGRGALAGPLGALALAADAHSAAAPASH
jgi:fructokinase